MPEGKIKKVIAEKGFGFIATGSDDLFFHHSELRGVADRATRRRSDRELRSRRRQERPLRRRRASLLVER